jgi:hypothetical protein
LVLKVSEFMLTRPWMGALAVAGGVTGGVVVEEEVEAPPQAVRVKTSTVVKNARDVRGLRVMGDSNGYEDTSGGERSRRHSSDLVGMG